MHKLVFAALMIVVWWMLQALQMDEEMAMGTLHEGKRAIDRAVHAAVQQTDRAKLELGILSIDKARAREAADEYLQANLRLKSDNSPHDDAFLRESVEIEVFEVIDETETFPYIYRNPRYDYEVTLDRPGVVMIARLKYPRTFNVLDPVEWDLKGSAEMVY